MKKSIFQVLFTISFLVLFFACSNTNKQGDANTTPAESTKKAQTDQDVLDAEAALGNLNSLVGHWEAVDDMEEGNFQISFGLYGDYKQKTEDAIESGTWKKIDETQIQLANQSAKEQVIGVSELSADAVKLTWNNENEKPKTILFNRVK